MQRSMNYRQLFASSALALSFLLTSNYPIAMAIASAPSEREVGAMVHFSVPEPATMSEALKLLHDSIVNIEQSLAASDFNAIHEATYSVESAISRIGKQPGYDGVKTLVSPRCEIVHLASEMHDAETLKAAVPTLAKAVREQLLTR